MTKYTRIDKNEARRAYDTNKVIVMSLNKPATPIGETVEFEGVTTVTKNGTGGQTFDKMAEEALQWKHRYPGSKGLVWYTPVPVAPTLTPYDTGERLEPHPWIPRDPGLAGQHKAESFGKVDFDDDEGGTVATLYIEKGEGGYALKGYANEPLTVDIDDQSGDGERPIIQPSAALQANVKAVIDELGLPVGEEVEVYWSANSSRAMILACGEKHVRKQLLLFVTDVGEGEVISAYVKDWAAGVRDTRIG